MKAKHILVLAALCSLASASVGVCMNTAGLFYNPIAEDLSVSVGSVSLTVTILTVASSFSGLLVPRIMKENTVFWIVACGMVLMSGGALIMSFAESVFLLYAGSILKGFGSGLVNFILITAISNNWFYKSHGLITSVILSFSGIPGVILSPLIRSMILTYGWRTANTGVAVLLALLCLPFLLFRVTIRPEKQGLKPYGYEEFIAEKEKGNIRVISSADENFSFHTPLFALTSTYMILVCLAAALPNHLPAYAESISMAGISGIILSMTLAGNIVSKLIFGIIVDRSGARNAIFLCAALSLSAMTVLILHPSELIVLIASFIANFTAANSATGVTMIVSDMFGEKNYSTAYPVISFIGSYAMAFSSAAMGFMYDLTGSYTVIFACIMAIQAAVIIVTMTSYSIRKKELV